MPVTEAFLECFHIAGVRTGDPGVGDCRPRDDLPIVGGEPRLFSRLTPGHWTATSSTMSKQRAMTNVLIYFGPSLEIRCIYAFHSLPQFEQGK